MSPLWSPGGRRSVALFLLRLCSHFMYVISPEIGTPHHSFIPLHKGLKTEILTFLAVLPSPSVAFVSPYLFTCTCSVDELMMRYTNGGEEGYNY